MSAPVMAPAPSDETLLEVAERFGTPTYLYDLDKVRAQVHRLRAAIPSSPLFYAVKANPCGALLRCLAELGLGAEVITLGELARALRAGIPAGRILLGGPRQDAPLIAAAQEAGVGWVSIDSASQAEAWLETSATVKFLVRLNPALDPRTHEHLATGAATSKFGVPFDEAAHIAERLGERLAGFHVHIGSQITELGPYNDVFRQLSELLSMFPGAETIDLGGGFAVPGFPLEDFAPMLRAFAELIGGRQLLLEPGRFLVGESGTLLTRVLHVKEGTGQNGVGQKGTGQKGAGKHVICDAGMAELLRPALYGARHPLRLVGKGGGGERVDVDGPLCENADRLAQNVELPSVAAGDLLAVSEAGAYGYAMSSHYASSLRPAEVVLADGEVRLVTERETVADLWRLERA